MEMREWKDPRNGTMWMIAREDAYPPRMSFRNRSTLEHYSTDRHPLLDIELSKILDLARGGGDS